MFKEIWNEICFLIFWDFVYFVCVSVKCLFFFFEVFIRYYIRIYVSVFVFSMGDVEYEGYRVSGVDRLVDSICKVFRVMRIVINVG